MEGTRYDEREGIKKGSNKEGGRGEEGIKTEIKKTNKGQLNNLRTKRYKRNEVN
jgi:hypothetical protein